MESKILIDIKFVKTILPDSYIVKRLKYSNNDIHCVSNIGIDSIKDENIWEYIFEKLKNNFGHRFKEIFHNTCTNHLDFIIYLKP